MSAPFDDSDFIDRDFTASQPARPSVATLPPPAPMNQPPHPPAGRPPTREELETHLTAKHQQLADLKARQEALERERVALEEARRRQAEFETSRPEMVQHLTRGLELLEKAEFQARREAEQMGKTLQGLREALTNVQAIRQETWTPETWQTELTRALTTIENARMEWNSARLKWPVLNGETAAAPGNASTSTSTATGLGGLAGHRFGELLKIGFALTWPLAAVALVALGVLTAILLRR